MKFKLCAILLITAAMSMCAQQEPRGQWSGNLGIPQMKLTVVIDLDKTPDGWIGSMSMPAQGSSGIPLDSITFADGKCTFRVKGGASFAGTLSDDGKTLTGEFMQGSNPFPLTLTRIGDPKVDTIKSSPAISKEFLGTWEGTLIADRPLRLLLKISNDATGSRATLISVDQDGLEIPVNTIEQKDSKLILTARMISGGYTAGINKEGSELNGTWTQGGNQLPLKMKKAGAETKKP